MQKIKTGKEEIAYLLSKCIEKYKADTGKEIITNTNRKNYEGLALTLSEISNQLPYTEKEKGHDSYAPDLNPRKLDYPYRKYDITGGQIKDALNGIVSNPRTFLIDSCYIYLYGVGRKTFENNPTDDNLLDKQDKQRDDFLGDSETDQLKRQLSFLQNNNRLYKKSFHVLLITATFFFLSLAVSLFIFYSHKKNWDLIKKNMNILPYQPTKMEIDSIEGVWLCYTGSPQARTSDTNRYHKIVSNLIDIKYKDGYFTFNRYGASFDHTGFIQFESPRILSMNSFLKGSDNQYEFPRHSLLSLDTRNSNFITVISASWNFDVEEKNRIIGIREVLNKQGKGGSIEEITNSVENAICQCKIIRWKKLNGQTENFYLKNELLDTISQKQLIPLLDENSILLKDQGDSMMISKGKRQ